MDDPFKLICIVCATELEKCSGHDSIPYGGTLFETMGHYGSTFFDPFDGQSKIEIVICDPCLKASEVMMKMLNFTGPESQYYELRK
jgi:hypothetical protein